MSGTCQCFFSKTFGELIYPTILVILATFAISQPHQLNISKMRLKLFWKCLEFWGEMDKDKLGVSLSLARFANTSWNRSIVQEMRHWKQGLGCKICSTEEANNIWPHKLFHIKGPPILKHTGCFFLTGNPLKMYGKPRLGESTLT